MGTRHHLAAALGAALMAAAMSGTAIAQDEALLYPAEGVDWRLDALYSDGALADVPPDVEVTLLLSEGDATGSAGCNSYFGGYDIDATSLRFPEPFASTREFCQGAAQVTEDAYLPLLEVVAGWTIDEAGVLSLSDASGRVTLVFSEPPVDPTTIDIGDLAIDIEDLAFELAGLQDQVGQAEQDIAALAAAVAAVDIERMDRRITGSENAIAEINATMGRFRNRITRLEDGVAEISTTIGKFRNRINKLEGAAEDHETRIAALESLVPATE